MESNRPVSEGSVVQSAGAGVCDAASSDDHQQVQSQARSYECSFCKKGFSNAQALGGHMNIHRKDKAKLKKAAAAARLPPESSRSVLSASSRITNKGKPLEFTSRQILGKDIKLGDMFRGNHVHHQQQQEVSSFPRLRNESQMAETMIQLPLFVETTAKRVVDYSKPLGQQHVSANWQEQMLLHSTNGGAGGGGGSSSMSAGLDLELRLGHSPSTPPESSTVTTGSFLKFF